MLVYEFKICVLERGREQMLDCLTPEFFEIQSMLDSISGTPSSSSAADNTEDREATERLRNEPINIKALASNSMRW